jgi:hypothetical protein
MFDEMVQRLFPPILQLSENHDAALPDSVAVPPEHTTAIKANRGI